MLNEPQTTPSGFNKQVFLPGDRVEVVRADMTITGEVIGVSLRNLIDMYIVLFEEPLKDYPWRAGCFPSTEMERIP